MGTDPDEILEPMPLIYLIFRIEASCLSKFMHALGPRVKTSSALHKLHDTPNNKTQDWSLCVVHTPLPSGDSKHGKKGRK